MQLYCCECVKDVDAELTDGKEVYPHRPDLYKLPFWKCKTCGNFVGCHHKTKNRTAPLGCIPSKEIKEQRIKIHALLDPLWRDGLIGRREVYEKISNKIGWQYHTAKIRSIEEAKNVYQIVSDISAELV